MPCLHKLDLSLIMSYISLTWFGINNYLYIESFLSVEKLHSIVQLGAITTHTVQYNTVLNTKGRISIRLCNHINVSHITPPWVSYEVSVVNIWKISNNTITVPHCIIVAISRFSCHSSSLAFPRVMYYPLYFHFLLSAWQGPSGGWRL